MRGAEGGVRSFVSRGDTSVAKKPSFPERHQKPFLPALTWSHDHDGCHGALRAAERATWWLVVSGSLWARDWRDLRLIGVRVKGYLNP